MNKEIKKINMSESLTSNNSVDKHEIKETLKFGEIWF